jgi:hypothetical protein
MSDHNCTTCRTRAAHILALEQEIALLYAAAQQATRENLEMRKRLQSWADDFSPADTPEELPRGLASAGEQGDGGAAHLKKRGPTTDKLPGAPAGPHNN